MQKITYTNKNNSKDGTAASKVTHQDLNEIKTVVNANADDSLLAAKVTVTSAQLLNCFTTPIEIIAAPGVGKAIQPVSVMRRYNFGTADYNTNVGLYSGSTSNGILYLVDLIEGSTTVRMSTLSSSIIAPNAAIILAHDTANPTTGDGSVEIYIIYKIITL